MGIQNKNLKRRIIEISYKHGLSHLGSCLTAVDIIKQIYDVKKPDEKFILSSGHAGLALYVVLEQKGGKNAEEIFNHHGVHPDRCTDCGIDCSSGSLGQGLPIATGMAIANPKRNVYCLISDGECAEGSIGESLRIANQYNLSNLNVYLNMNGWAAYQDTQSYVLPVKPPNQFAFYLKETNNNQFPFLKGLDAHYYVMKDEDYKLAMEILK